MSWRVHNPELVQYNLAICLLTCKICYASYQIFTTHGVVKFSLRFTFMALSIRVVLKAQTLLISFPTSPPKGALESFSFEWDSYSSTFEILERFFVEYSAVTVVVSGALLDGVAHKN